MFRAGTAASGSSCMMCQITYSEVIWVNVYIGLHRKCSLLSILFYLIFIWTFRFDFCHWHMMFCYLRKILNQAIRIQEEKGLGQQFYRGKMFVCIIKSTWMNDWYLKKNIHCIYSGVQLARLHITNEYFTTCLGFGKVYRSFFFFYRFPFKLQLFFAFWSGFGTYYLDLDFFILKIWEVINKSCTVSATFLVMTMYVMTFWLENVK